MQDLRKKMQIIFQDPYASLNPRMTVGDIIGEPMDIYNIAKGHEREEKVLELMSTVGLGTQHIRRYPHEFSGGQRQRIGIARALAVNPELIVCDEPVSALDVSVRSQVLNLMQELQRKYKLTYLFISHDLSVVKHISDRVSVMYLGKVVEISEKNELYDKPLHPYTKALLSAIPIPDPVVKRERIILEGDVPTPINPPNGCRFNTRCQYAKPICSQEEPVLKDVGTEHFIACHLY
jgi:oligopeptide transport system ATP-binding protein